MNRLSGKRILFLEGENMIVPVLQKAKKYGVYSVIVNMYGTDRNPAKLIADKHCYGHAGGDHLRYDGSGRGVPV